MEEYCTNCKFVKDIFYDIPLCKLGINTSWVMLFGGECSDFELVHVQ
jgi:hypothetical protein